MKNAHLWNCPNCDLANPVEPRQAGQSLVCAGCKKEFEAPKLRELTQLPLSNPEGKPSKQVSGSAKQTGSSAMFAIGLAMAIIGGAAGGTLYRYASSLIPDISPDEYVARQNELLDTVPINQLYARWEELYAQRHVPEWQESEVKSLYKQSGYLKTIATGLLAVAAGGVLMTGFSLLSSRRSLQEQ